MKGKLTSTLKACAVVVIASVSFGAYAGSCDETVYVGNPSRPDTIWIPGHCGKGCWHQGYYMKYIDSPTCKNIYWQQGYYDRRGNYIEGHWQPLRYTVVGSY